MTPPSGFAALGRAAATGAASPEITAAVAAYWAGTAGAMDASDKVIALRCKEIEAAAARIAAAPCRGLADLAAKIVFALEVLSFNEALDYVTEAERAAVASIEADALALALADGAT